METNKEERIMEKEKQTSKRIIIPITNYDLEIFKEIVNGTTTHDDWAFDTDCGELIKVKVIKEKGEE